MNQIFWTKFVERAGRLRSAHNWLAAFLLAAVFCTFARAQVLYGTLTGNVTDSTGAAIPGATVKAVNTDTGLNRTSETNDAGIYKFSDLAPGNYVVTIDAAGLSPFKQSNLPIVVNNTARLDAALSVGSVSQSILVTDAPPTL